MRFFGSVGGGIVMGLLLFFIMTSLIAGKANVNRDDQDLKLVDFIRVQQDEITQLKDRTPPKKPKPPKQPPPPPKLTVTDQNKPPPTPLNIETPKIDIGMGGGGPFLGAWSPGDAAAEGDVVPIVKIQPQWPREALLNGTEGWVKVQFTIMEDGTVGEASVVEAQPRRLFDRNAIRAILRWKFKPRIIDGKPVQRQAVQTIEFKLDET